MEEKKKRTIALILVSVAWIVIYSGRLIAPTLLLQIERDLGISHQLSGIALTSMWLMYGFMQYPGGALSDSIGRKKVIILSLSLFGIAMFLVGTVINFYMLVLTFSLVGMTAGLFPSASLTMIAEMFGPKKGKALGIRSALGSFSGLLPTVLPVISFMIGWRTTFFIWTGLAFLIAYVFYSLVEETLKSPQERSIFDRFKLGFKSLKDKNTAFMFVINLIVSFAWIGMMSWFPTYIQEAKDLNAEIAGILFTVVLLGGFVMKPILGHLSDRINKFWIILFLVISSSVSLFLLVMVDSLLSIIVVSFLFAQTGAFYPVRTSYLLGYWQSETSGTKLGIFRSGIILLGSPIATFIGWSAEIYGFDLAILIVSSLLAIASFLILGKIILNRWHPLESCMEIGKD